jgi:asparagine synthase (glutamine-hydrolysing)
MSAFAGILRHDHRPIDDQWIERLCSQPAAAGRTPHIIRAAGSLCVVQYGPPTAHHQPGLVFDGRLDNRGELATSLRLTAADLPDTDDTRLIAHACDRWRDDCVARLFGDFAIAHWSGERLFLARDPLGGRAIYYYDSPTTFAFATELRPLLELPFIPRQLRDASIADFLESDGSEIAGTTFYEQIRVLPSGHTMTVEGGTVRQHRYWRAEDLPAVRLASDDCARELRTRITTAVDDCLRGGTTVAVHLSGGLDSSAVACLAARRLREQGRRLIALCSVMPGGYAGPEHDERAFIDAVLAQEDNIDPIWIELPLDADPFRAHTRWFNAMGQPSFSNVVHIEEQLGEAGRAHGVDVVLSGFGGDFFASWRGGNVIREIVRHGHWRLAVRELRALRRRQRVGWWPLIRQELVGPLQPERVRAMRQSRKRQPGPIHPGLSRRRAHERGRPASDPSSRSLSPRESMIFVLEPGHAEQALAPIAQVFAREFSQQLRFPLVDRRVAELAVGMPAGELQQDGWPRSLMRRAMSGILPEMVRLRPDKGPAFDPAIMSRIVAARPQLQAWAEATAENRWWTYVDRARFLDALAAVAPAARSQWRREVFTAILKGGNIARFLEWHEAWNS